MNDLRKALSGLLSAAEAFEADQSVATDQRVGIVQPITVKEGLALNKALDNARKVLRKYGERDEYEKMRDEMMGDLLARLGGDNDSW